MRTDGHGGTVVAQGMQHGYCPTSVADGLPHEEHIGVRVTVMLCIETVQQVIGQAALLASPHTQVHTSPCLLHAANPL